MCSRGTSGEPGEDVSVADEPVLVLGGCVCVGRVCGGSDVDDANVAVVGRVVDEAEVGVDVKNETASRLVVRAAPMINAVMLRNAMTLADSTVVPTARRLSTLTRMAQITRSR